MERLARRGERSSARAQPAEGRPSLEEFVTEARTWLASVLERSPDSRLSWGQGSDSVALFQTLDFARERSHIEAARKWQQLKSRAGYGSITWEERYGGRSLPAEYERAFRAIEAEFVIPPGHEALGITMELIAPTIRAHGTDAQRDRYIRRMRAGDELWCQLFSEPGAGSDLAGIQTFARRKGAGWVINGQKVWTSGAQFAKFGYILCRTGRDVPKHAGMTAFVIPMERPGIEVRPLRQMTGGSSFNEVFLDNVHVADSARLGQEGHGWRVALTTLGFERASTSGASKSPGTAPWSRAIDLARHLEVNRDPVVRQQLAQIYTGGRVISLTRRRVLDNARNGTPGPEGSISKLLWTNALRLTSDVVSSMLGPAAVADPGRWGEYAWAEFILGVPGYRIAGGSDEIQRNIIAERVLGLPAENRNKTLLDQEDKPL